jgi:hypothetical protein
VQGDLERHSLIVRSAALVVKLAAGVCGASWVHSLFGVGMTVLSMCRHDRSVDVSA